mgnify:CR=1 FL=1
MSVRPNKTIWTVERPTSIGFTVLRDTVETKEWERDAGHIIII